MAKAWLQDRTQQEVHVSEQRSSSSCFTESFPTSFGVCVSDKLPPHSIVLHILEEIPMCCR